MDALHPEEYEKMYEDGLFRLSQALSDLATVTERSSPQEICEESKKKEDPSSSSLPSKEERRAATRVLLARTNIDGILQQQINSKVTGNPQIGRAAALVLHQWRLDQAQSANPLVMKRQQSILRQTLSSPSSLLNHVCSNERSKENMLCRFGASTDDLFDMYPEMMQTRPSDSDDSSSSCDDEVGQNEVTGPPKRSRITEMKEHDDSKSMNTTRPMNETRSTLNPYARQATTSRIQQPKTKPSFSSEIDAESRPSSSASSREGFQYTPVVDPVHVQNDNITNTNDTPPFAHRQQNAPHASTTAQNQQYSQKCSSQRAPSLSDHSSWDDHQRQNPFQTAREYSWATGGTTANTTNNRPSRADDTDYNSNRQNPQSVTTHSSAASDSASGSQTIRESLKRKFQPPIKRAVSEKSQPGTRSMAQKQVSKPSQQVDPQNQSGDTENDELPECLKRYGKELVQKIESEIMDGGDPITFDDIAGLNDAKQTIQEVICWPMKRPDLFTGLRKAPNGLLLYGPPGTGKTLIGKAIAHESGATFFSISSSSLTSKWIGEGEKLVRTMFAVAAYREPSVVFIDEIDSLLTQRKSDENEASRRIKTEFLVQLDGTGTTAQGRVLTIGATNRPQELDEAARRRFVKRLYIPLPIEADRAILLNVLLQKNNHRLTADEISKLARETEGFSGADLKALCTDAAMGPIRMLGSKALDVQPDDIPPISYKHFRQSLRSMKPSVSPADLVQYVEWDKVYGSKRVEDTFDDEVSEDEDDNV